MDRLHSMSRFDENIPDHHPVTVCGQCGEDLYNGDEVHRLPNDIKPYCCVECLLEASYYYKEEL